MPSQAVWVKRGTVCNHATTDGGLMPDDNPSPDLLREISERLKYLESVVSEQVSRLYAIEQKLGIAYRPRAPRTTPSEQSGETDIERGGVEATRRRPSVPAPPVERPPQPRSMEPGSTHSPGPPPSPHEPRLAPPPERPIQPSAPDRQPAGTSTPRTKSLHGNVPSHVGTPST